MRVVWTRLSVSRLEEYARFIAADRPEAAARWAAGAFDLVKPPGRFPRRGRIVPELGREEIREVLYGAYRLIYRIEPKRIAILTVRHARQQMEQIDLSEAGP
jgi:toxin ParE1/3/4